MSGSTPSKAASGPRGAAFGSGPAAAPAAGRGAPSSGRLRSDFTRPPSASSLHRTPLRGAGGKDAATAGQQQTPSGAGALTPRGGAAAGTIGNGNHANGAVDFNGLTPSVPAYAHTNALYGADDVGMTPSVRTREYTPSLSAGQPAPQHPFGPAAGGADDAGPLTAGAAASAAMPQHPRKLGAPSPFLQSHGDLWVGGDQDDRDDIALEVHAPSQASVVAPAASNRAAAPAAAPGGAPAAPQSALLVLPGWLRARPFSTALHLAGAAALRLEAEAEGEPPPDLRALPEAVREAALVDDLLYCFMGVPGRCLRPAVVDDGGRRFTRGPAVAFAPAAALDERSAELVRKLLPLPEYAAVVERFAVTRDRWAACGGGHACGGVGAGKCGGWQQLLDCLHRRAALRCADGVGS
jgi:hypothetical protein